MGNIDRAGRDLYQISNEPAGKATAKEQASSKGQAEIKDVDKALDAFARAVNLLQPPEYEDEISQLIALTDRSAGLEKVDRRELLQAINIAYKVISKQEHIFAKLRNGFDFVRTQLMTAKIKQGWKRGSLRY